MLSPALTYAVLRCAVLRVSLPFSTHHNVYISPSTLYPKIHAKRRALRMFDQYVMGVSDFTFLKKLNTGAYATVFLARRKDTGQYCAIKVRYNVMLFYLMCHDLMCYVLCRVLLCYIDLR